MSMQDVLSNGVQALAGIGANAREYLPEPALSGVGLFQDVMEVASDIGDGFIGGVSTGVTGDFADLIKQQIEVQQELQATSMVSNIERSKHETNMAAIRNIRVA